MVRFEGDRDFKLAPADLFGRLTDVGFLVQCVPDVEKVVEQQADRAVLVLRPGFAFVRGTLDVTLQVAEAVAPASARVLMHSKGIGSTADVEARLTFGAHESGSRVHWVAEVKSLTGLLKLVPSGLVRGAAQKVVEDVWRAVEAKLGGARETASGA